MVLTMLYACGGEQTVSTDAVLASTNDPNSNPTYDTLRGEGKFTKVEVGLPDLGLVAGNH